MPKPKLYPCFARKQQDLPDLHLRSQSKEAKMRYFLKNMFFIKNAFLVEIVEIFRIGTYLLAGPTP